MTPDFLTAAVGLVAFLFSVIVHENAHGLAAEHFGADRLVGRGDLPGPPAEKGRGGDIGRQALQVAGAVLRLGTDAGRLGGAGHTGWSEQGQRLDPGRGRLARVAAAEAIEAVVGEDRAGDDRGGGRAVILGIRQNPGERGGTELARLLGDYRCGEAEPLGVGLIALAEADDQSTSWIVRVEERQLFEVCLDEAGAEHQVQISRQIIALEQSGDEEVGNGLVERLLADIDSHGTRVYELPSRGSFVAYYVTKEPQLE